MGEGVGVRYHDSRAPSEAKLCASLRVEIGALYGLARKLRLEGQTRVTSTTAKPRSGQGQVHTLFPCPCWTQVHTWAWKLPYCCANVWFLKDVK